jgi:transcription initiation factor TFIIA large subunit
VDFEEYGMDEEQLHALQKKWEDKLLETRVAEFAYPAAAEGDEAPSAPPALNGSHPAPEPNAQSSGEVQVKSEPEDPLRLRGGAVS